MRGRRWGFLLLFLLLPGVSFAGEKGNAGTITGVVLLEDGKPMAGGKMVFFRKGSGPPPRPSRYYRPPDELVDIGDNGVFTAILPEGSYYLSAIRKKTADLIGPPAEGDHVYPSPVDLESGEIVYSVRKGETTDIGTASAVSFSRESLPIEETITAMEGSITDLEGNPVAGAIALAFGSPHVTGKPQFISERTGGNGKYRVRVSEGGTYYIKIRTALKGGHPEQKELIGVYGGAKSMPVIVATGEVVTGIDIQGKVFGGSGTGSLRKGESPRGLGGK